MASSNSKLAIWPFNNTHNLPLKILTMLMKRALKIYYIPGELAHLEALTLEAWMVHGLNTVSMGQNNNII